MKNFPVDEDLVALIWQMANPKPFENITFSEALRRVLDTMVAPSAALDTVSRRVWTAQELLDELIGMPMSEEELEDAHRKVKEKRAKRASSPKPTSWLLTVPELKDVKGLHTWKDVCDHLGISVAGDSGRRKVLDWVKTNRPKWPPVPDVG